MNETLSQICRRAIPRMGTGPLLKKEEFADLYVERSDSRMEDLRLRLSLVGLRNKVKYVASGHIGSGKSTELYRLKRGLEESQDRVTVLFLEFSSLTNLVGMNAVRLLEVIARQVNSLLSNSKTGLSPDDLDAEIEAARSHIRRVRKSTESMDANAKVELSAGPVAAGAGARTEHSREEESTYESVPDPNAMLACVNRGLKRLRSSRPEAEILIICDDLEKLDLAVAQSVFSESLALGSVDAAVVYTAPIALLYSEHRRYFRGFGFDDETWVLPVVKIRGRDGTPQQAGLDQIRELLRRRIPELDVLISRKAQDELILRTGGVLRDLLRSMNNLCYWVLTSSQTERLGPESLSKAFRNIQADFRRTVPQGLYGRLEGVAGSTGEVSMDDELARLINLGVVLEYQNDETWFRIHPLAEFLVADSQPAR